MLVWAASYPRSGSNLVRTALRSGWGIDGPEVTRPPARPRRGLLALLGRRGGPAVDPRIAEFRASDRTRALKTHVTHYARTPDPALYLVRDGRDALLSLSYFAHDRPEFAQGRSREEILFAMIEGAGGPRGSWSESVGAWTNRSAPTAVIRFEELREDPQGVARRALGELGLDPGEPREPMPSLEQMRERHPHLVRRGRVGDWRREMSEQAIERFAELHGETLVRLGYERSADPADWDLTPAG